VDLSFRTHLTTNRNVKEKPVVLEGELEIKEWVPTIDILNVCTLSIEIVLFKRSIIGVRNDPKFPLVAISNCFDLNSFSNFDVIIEVTYVVDRPGTGDSLVEVIILFGVFITIAMS
jgi:hypothetical protein